METMIRDLRHAVRMWLRNPGFTAVAVATLALGIGANTTMFSVVNATLLRPLPFPDADRLTTVWKSRITDPDDLNIVSYPNYRDYLERSTVFEHLALFDSAGRGYTLTGQGAEAEQASGVRVTASFFDVLGVRPQLGRTFLPEEEQPGRDRVVVLSHGLWSRRFAADPSILEKTIQIDGRAYTVVGVMPSHFQFQFWSVRPRELWVPAGWTEGDLHRWSNSFVSIGRLKPGVGLAEARIQMDAIGRGLEKEYPDANAGQTVRLIPMSEYGLTQLRPALAAMLTVVGFVLLIACVNVANLMLARAATRHRELAIRCALGASRGQIVRQLMAESVLLALVGGAGGVLLAVWGTSLLLPILPANLRAVPLRPMERIDIDAVVLAFTFGVSVLSGVLFGLAPALASFRADLNHPLKEQARGSTAGRSRLRYGLVAAEVALTLLVLAGAGVMIVSVARLLAVDPGLDPENVLVMQMSLPQEDLYYGPPGNPRFCQDLDQQVGGLPGVEGASAIAHLPLSGGGAGRGIAIEGRPDPDPNKPRGAGYSVACPNILRTLGVPLVAGREFTHRDTVDAPGVALVNETMAKRDWPGEDPVGKRFKIGDIASDAPWLTVVGVFKDVRASGLDRKAFPSFLRVYTQAAWPSMTIVTKTSSAPAAFLPAIKRALRVVEPNQAASGVATMEEIVALSVSSRWFPMLLLSGFALLALVLAAVGTAGVVGYSVAQRTQEIGVRMALGAHSRDVLGLLIRQSLRWTAIGVGAGLAAAIVLLPFLRTLVYEVTPADPFVLAAVSLVLVGVVLAATYLPARRAARIDPVAALRGD